MNQVHKGTVLIMALAVSACSTGVVPRAPVAIPGSAAPPGTRSAAQEPFRPAPALTGGALDGVIGSRASKLVDRFGDARIDLREGDARKLQFLGSACVLDIFLYPLSARSEPVATHVEARLRSDGSDVDRRACIQEVEARRQ